MNWLMYKAVFLGTQPMYKVGFLMNWLMYKAVFFCDTSDV